MEKEQLLELRETKRLTVPALLGCLLAAVFLSASSPEREDSFAFAVLGDHGCGCAAQQSVANQMLIWSQSKPFSTVLMLGDIIYGDDMLFGLIRTGKRGGDPALFAERFDSYYKPLLGRDVQFYAALGNHDLEADDGKAMIADRDRFHILGDRGYYSFSPEGKDGLVEFFALSSNGLVKGRNDPDQLRWLKNSLAKSNAIWKIAFAHHPLYSSKGSHRVDSRYRQAVEPLLVSGGVQAFLAGHNHYYARLKPQQGVHYFISGGGGRELRNPRENEYTERIVGTYHFMYFEARTDSLEYWAVSSTGTLLDRGSITR